MGTHQEVPSYGGKSSGPQGLTHGSEVQGRRTTKNREIDERDLVVNKWSKTSRKAGKERKIL